MSRLHLPSTRAGKQLESNNICAPCSSFIRIQSLWKCRPSPPSIVRGLDPVPVDHCFSGQQPSWPSLVSPPLMPPRRMFSTLTMPRTRGYKQGFFEPMIFIGGLKRRAPIGIISRFEPALGVGLGAGAVQYHVGILF